MPWDLLYIGAQIVPQLNQVVDMSKYYEVLKDFFLKFGIDISKYNITYDLFLRKNKSEWRYSFTIRLGKDNRVLANVENRYHEYGVLLHETGHVIHSFMLDPDDILLNMGISGIISEGFANLWGNFLYEKIFYQQFFQNDIQSVEKAFNNLKQWQKISRIRAVPDIFFDQLLHTTEIKTLNDINELYHKQYKLYLEVEPYTDNPPWAYRIHHTTHPIYLHNYFLGDLTCEMLKYRFLKTERIKSVAEKPKEFSDFHLQNVI